MGKSTGEIERDITRQRDDIASRIDTLDHQVRRDIESVKEQAFGRALAAVEAFSDALTTSAGSGTAVARHPQALIAGSAGAGFVAGWLTGGESQEADHADGRARPAAHREAPRDERGDGDGEGPHISGPLQAVMGPVIGSLSAWIGGWTSHLLESAVDDFVQGFKHERQNRHEVVPAESGSAQVGYEETREPSPIEKATGKIRDAVGGG